MTEQSDSPLVRGLIDHEAVEDDGSEVEDATETLLWLRSEGELPDGVDELEDVKAKLRDSEASHVPGASGDGAPAGTGAGDDCDARDPT